MLLTVLLTHFDAGGQTCVYMGMYWYLAVVVVIACLLVCSFVRLAVCFVCSPVCLFMFVPAVDRRLTVLMMYQALNNDMASDVTCSVEGSENRRW